MSIITRHEVYTWRGKEQDKACDELRSVMEQTFGRGTKTVQGAYKLAHLGQENNGGPVAGTLLKILDGTTKSPFNRTIDRALELMGYTRKIVPLNAGAKVIPFHRVAAAKQVRVQRVRKSA
jgi:hypothetical protein